VKERNILAGFSTEEAAVKAKQTLQQAGFSTVQVDFIEQFPGSGVDTIVNPAQGRFSSLGNLVLSGDFSDHRDAGALAAVHPDASGMADRDLDNMDSSYLLTAVVPENRYEEALNIVRSQGGMV